MNKIIILLITITFCNTHVNAQKFAYIDTDYILKKMPDFVQAEEKIDDYSIQWQKEIEEMYKEIERMYQNYQSEKVLLTE